MARLCTRGGKRVRIGDAIEKRRRRVEKKSVKEPVPTFRWRTGGGLSRFSVWVRDKNILLLPGEFVRIIDYQDRHFLILLLVLESSTEKYPKASSTDAAANLLASKTGRELLYPS